MTGFSIKSREAVHIVVSWLTISFAFAYVGDAFNFQFANLGTMLFAVGTAFILHELAHKYVAITYGAYAEYRAWALGLVLAVGMALLNFGIVFAAPGAVYVYGPHLTRKQNAYVSLAGPLTNFLLGWVFVLAAGAFSSSLSTLMLRVAYVNFFLGAFNMLPVPPLDGSKVFSYNPGMGLGMLLLIVASMFML